LTNPVFILAGELFAPDRAGIVGKSSDSLDDSLQIALGDKGRKSLDLNNKSELQVLRFGFVLSILFIPVK